MSCPHCQEDAKFVGYRSCRPTCLFGKIVYERAYYYCRHCKSGWFPTDAEFGIEGHQTSGAREVISLLGELEAHDMTRASPEALEAHRQLLGYIRNNQHRMDYRTYISRGWQIGSGTVEAACKTVVCQRLKESGMRWREHGTTALSQLRALYKSEPKLWKNYWNRTLCS